MDRERARLPLDGPRRIAVLGCTSGAGQSVIALMTGHMLAAARAVPVAALDLNPGEGSLAARIEPVTSVTALLAGPRTGPRETPRPDHARDAARGRGPRAAWTSSPARRRRPAARAAATTSGWPACWPSGTR